MEIELVNEKSYKINKEGELRVVKIDDWSVNILEKLQQTNYEFSSCHDRRNFLKRKTFIFLTILYNVSVRIKYDHRVYPCHIFYFQQYISPINLYFFTTLLTISF